MSPPLAVDFAAGPKLATGVAEPVLAAVLSAHFVPGPLRLQLYVSLSLGSGGLAPRSFPQHPAPLEVRQ